MIEKEIPIQIYTLVTSCLAILGEIVILYTLICHIITLGKSLASGTCIS